MLSIWFCCRSSILLIFALLFTAISSISSCGLFISILEFAATNYDVIDAWEGALSSTLSLDFSFVILEAEGLNVTFLTSWS